MKKYKVYDLYECEFGAREVLGYADNMKEIKRLAKERYNDTDGECDIWYAELNIETQKYKFSNAKHLETF